MYLLKNKNDSKGIFVLDTGIYLDLIWITGNFIIIPIGDTFGEIQGNNIVWSKFSHRSEEKRVTQIHRVIHEFSFADLRFTENTK